MAADTQQTAEAESRAAYEQASADWDARRIPAAVFLRAWQVRADFCAGKEQVREAAVVVVEKAAEGPVTEVGEIAVERGVRGFVGAEQLRLFG